MHAQWFWFMNTDVTLGLADTRAKKLSCFLFFLLFKASLPHLSEGALSKAVLQDHEGNKPCHFQKSLRLPETTTQAHALLGHRCCSPTPSFSSVDAGCTQEPSWHLWPRSAAWCSRHHSVLWRPPVWHSTLTCHGSVSALRWPPFL